MTDMNTLNIAVLYGSTRGNRQGIKAARFMLQQLQARKHSATLVDTQAYQLPMLDRMFKEYESGTAPEAMQAGADILSAADGFLVMSAEYNHSIPAAMKNLLDHFQSEYHYKPSAIATYSAGPFGGVRGLVNMRAILAELGTPSIPSAFPISKVHAAFDDDGNDNDGVYTKRVGKFLDEFEWYARALKAAREAENCTNGDPIQQGLCRG